MRLFLSTPLWGRTRGGVSFNPNEIGRRSQRRTLASPANVKIAPFVRPTHSYYGVPLDGPAIEEEPDQPHDPLHDLWTIIRVSAWLAIHGFRWLVIVAAIVIGWGIVLMSVLIRAR